MNRKIFVRSGRPSAALCVQEPRRNLVKLVKVGKLVAGKMFPPQHFYQAH